MKYENCGGWGKFCGQYYVTQYGYNHFDKQTVQFYTKQHRRRITGCNDVNVRLSKITFRNDLRHNF